MAPLQAGLLLPVKQHGCHVPHTWGCNAGGRTAPLSNEATVIITATAALDSGIFDSRFGQRVSRSGVGDHHTAKSSG